MTQHSTSIVKLYATAIFDYALANNKLESISEEANQLKDFLSKDDQWVKHIAAPIYSYCEQKNLLEKIAKPLNLSATMSNFLVLLAKNKRLNLLSDILNNLYEIVCKNSGCKIVEVTSAHNLLEADQKNIKNNLEEMFSSKIDLTFKVDPEIIGGIVVKVDNKMFDSSLRSKFTVLTRSVKKKLALL